MTTKTLYFDESGFTGHNLLDENQPIFAIVSTDIEPSIAEVILRESFPNYRGAEYKFSNIWRSKNKKGLVEIGRKLETLGKHVFSWMIDKRFCVLTKIVDFLIEPFLTNAGYDFYADGFCWKYTNYIHFGLQQFATKEFHGRLLKAYQRFSRNSSPQSLRRLQRVLHGLKLEASEELVVFFEQMELGARLFTQFNDLATFTGSDEIQMTSMVAVVGHWRNLHSEDFTVVHDSTANFFRRQEIWERMTNADVPNQVLWAGDGTYVEFPLRVLSTIPVDSKANYSVQFCDVLAGLITKISDPRIVDSDRELLNEVIDAGMGEITYNGIRPGTTFPDEIPPKRLAGPDNADRMAEIIFGSHHAHRDKLER